MSEETNKELVRRFIEEIINTGDVTRIADFVGDDYVEVYEGKKYPLGIDGAKTHVTGVRATYPDLHVTVNHQIAEGDWVASSITARGIHKGWWMGIKPTGKSVTFSGVNVDKIVDGKIAEHGGAANLLGPLLEIGAIEVVGDSSEPHA
ncbi:MAG: ester cyclase [Planctomycetota bacterium]|jgi:predicted ester cyclase